MRVKPGPDREGIEKKTRASFEDEFQPKGGRGRAYQPSAGTEAPEPSGYEARTVIARSRRIGSREREVAADSPTDLTRIYRPGAKSAAAHPPQGAASAMDDPPVGWLVVVRGLGQGRTVTLGHGMNPIGRDRGERVCIDFGDRMISRRRHASSPMIPRAGSSISSTAAVRT